MIYRKKATQPMTPWHINYPMKGVSISDADLANGSPKMGDMIAFNPTNEGDKWLVAEEYFKANYVAAEEVPLYTIEEVIDKLLACKDLAIRDENVTTDNDGYLMRYRKLTREKILELLEVKHE